MEGQKHVLYQWSLPEGNARHVQDSAAHTCMDERCERHFGLLGAYPSTRVEILLL